MSALFRFIATGAINSLVGYGIILLGLKLGWGDYGANAAGYTAGLSTSFVLQRQWVFAVRGAFRLEELARFCAAAAVAYGVNLVVIGLGRSMGHVGDPLVQALAVAAYSVTFFAISRTFVFAGKRQTPRQAEPTPDDADGAS